MPMTMELSFDLVEEILSWVPAKSLDRLRYTCKQWATLIADPRFVNKHLSHMRGREQQFTVFNDVSYYSLGSTFSCAGINFGLNMQVFEPLPCSNLSVNNMYHCDGLLLFVSWVDLLVLNPLLKQARWIGCGNDLTLTSDAYGLGYINRSSSSGNDYKIVRFGCGISNNSSIKLYDFKSDSWKVVDKIFDGFLESPESSVCVRGTPYWIGYVNGKTCKTIESFDFSKERFVTLFLPPSSTGSSELENSLSLGVFRGDKLSLLHESRVTGKIHLWVMKNHWRRLMTVSTAGFPMFSKYSSYFIENNGKLVLSFRGMNYIIIHVVGKDDECHNVQYLSMDPLISGSGCYYVPSLIPVPGFNEAKRRRSGFAYKKRRYF